MVRKCSILNRNRNRNLDGNGYALPGRLVMVLYLGDVLGAVCVYAVCVCVWLVAVVGMVVE